jgi:short-subunit dehydrogenase
MEKVADTLTNLYGVHTRIIQYDFSKLSTVEEVQNLFSILDTFKEDISVLVNNVGKGVANPLTSHSKETIFELNHINIHS